MDKAYQERLLTLPRILYFCVALTSLISDVSYNDLYQNLYRGETPKGYSYESFQTFLEENKDHRDIPPLRFCIEQDQNCWIFPVLGCKGKDQDLLFGIQIFNWLRTQGATIAGSPLGMIFSDGQWRNAFRFLIHELWHAWDKIPTDSPLHLQKFLGSLYQNMLTHQSDHKTAASDQYAFFMVTHEINTTDKLIFLEDEPADENIKRLFNIKDSLQNDLLEGPEHTYNLVATDLYGKNYHAAKVIMGESDEDYIVFLDQEGRPPQKDKEGNV